MGGAKSGNRGQVKRVPDFLHRHSDHADYPRPNVLRAGVAKPQRPFMVS